MTPGKIASQAGHAYLQSFLKADRDIQLAYHADGIGTKIALQSRAFYDLLWAQHLCVQKGLPHALIVDSGHVMLPHFDGSPIVTALGIGPVRRAEIGHITDRFKLL